VVYALTSSKKQAIRNKDARADFKLVTTRVAPAAEEDFVDVLSILDEAAAFLQDIGVTAQWPAKISTDATWTQILAELITNRKSFIAWQDRQPVGVFHLREIPELGPFKDQAWDDVPGEALYLYHLAVRRSVAGKGVATAMLEWAYNKAVSSGRHLRLDCWAGNIHLRGYYLEAGFEHLGDIEITSSLDGRRYSVSRFQRHC
jgi:GNAT superfamily N-acetyltransferase